jgi:hypothetical protein
MALGGFCLALPMATGCGGPGGPQGKVHGKATYQGKPINGGSTVSFLSESGGAAAGKVEADGSYQLRSMNGDNIPAGKYKVLISPPALPDRTPEEAMKASMPAEIGKNSVKGPVADPTIPDQYRAITTTPLSYEVKQGDNEINLELKDEAK